MRLGICIKGFFKGDLFDVDLPGRGCWTHSSVEHILGFTEEDFDFDEDHLVDWLLEHRYSCGTYLPESICIKLKERIDPNDEWVNRNLNWLIKELHYNNYLG